MKKILPNAEKNGRKLGLMEVFSIASGSMISSGLFVLPAVVYDMAGPAIIAAYFFAALLILPAMFSKTELSTAMPKSGGTYFFIYRSCGPLFGTFAGFASWFSLSLKSAFALIGIGVFAAAIFPQISPEHGKLIAIGLTLFFTFLNAVSVEKSGKFQVVLVFFLLAVLIFYIGTGLQHINVTKYSPFLRGGFSGLFTATAMVFISYGGLTKIASVADEIKDPAHTIERGMFSAFFIVSIIYIAVMFVTTGILEGREFHGNYAPLSFASKHYLGNPGFILLSFAAMAAFSTTAHAGLLAASRNPLAMAKDNLLPSFLAKISVRFQTPVVSIIFTSAFMIFCISVLDLESLVKTASTMMLLLFTLVNLSVIIMRESKISSYKPTFRSPMYPYIQILGIIFYLTLIAIMGVTHVIMTVVFFILTFIWYLLYSKRREHKNSAIIHLVERVTSREIKTSTLPDELKSILYERDSITEDRFDEMILDAELIDLKNEMDYNGLFTLLAEKFSEYFKIEESILLEKFHSRENESTTAIHKGLAIPHIIVDGESNFKIIVIRSQKGISFGDGTEPVHIVFALAGTKDERKFHLQALMAIAQIVQNRNFSENWLAAKNERALRNLILVAERVRTDQL